jgi:hypothetical protein
MLRPAEQLLLEKVLAAMAKTGIKAKLESFERKSEMDFDVVVRCKSDTMGTFGAWLPLVAIRELTVWTRREIASMTDYPEMTEEGDWSGVRDTNREAIWEIFRQHVPKVPL